MGFRKPISTLGGLNWWSNIKQNERFIMQKHKLGVPVWPYKYRILMRENRMEIANSNDKAEISYDWNYLENNIIPQLDKKIDWISDVKIPKELIEILTKMVITRK